MAVAVGGRYLPKEMEVFFIGGDFCLGIVISQVFYGGGRRRPGTLVPMDVTRRRVWEVVVLPTYCVQSSYPARYEG